MGWSASRASPRREALLLRDNEVVVQRAVGWMLREVGKRERAELVEFLDMHAPSMQKAVLRSATRQLPRNLASHYLPRS